MEKNNGYVYFDGVGRGKGGLCDRLKGMYSCYCLAIKLNKTFYYNIPFPVALKAINYQQPKNDDYDELNIIDWDNYLSYKSKIENLSFDSINYKIHTNIDFSNDLKIEISFGDFISSIFNLKTFQEEHNIYGYDIGIHIRCGGKMVEWNDCDFGVSFDETKFKEKIIQLSNTNQKEIYICSDSQKVLDITDSLNLKNISISPYNPRHIDRSENVNEEDYITTFSDLLTLANCELIYHTQGEFAKTASKIYNNEIRHLFNE
jgi:hypothetical protein